jgi:hypothetical protein
MLFALSPSPRLMYAFRFVDPGTGKWIRARYRAEIHIIAERYKQWEVIGAPEVRSATPWVGFNPYRIVTHAELARLEEPQPDMQPAVDATERFLLAVFLRRYVTWCARRRRFAAMNGAARLFAEVRAVALPPSADASYLIPRS